MGMGGGGGVEPYNYAPYMGLSTQSIWDKSPSFPHLVPCPDPTSKEEKGLVNLGRILGPALRNFHAPIRSLLWHCHVTSLPQECNNAILAVQAKLHMQSC